MHSSHFLLDFRGSRDQVSSSISVFGPKFKPHYHLQTNVERAPMVVFVHF